MARDKNCDVSDSPAVVGDCGDGFVRSSGRRLECFFFFRHIDHTGSWNQSCLFARGRQQYEADDLGYRKMYWWVLQRTRTCGRQRINIRVLRPGGSCCVTLLRLSCGWFMFRKLVVEEACSSAGVDTLEENPHVHRKVKPPVNPGAIC